MTLTPVVLLTGLALVFAVASFHPRAPFLLGVAVILLAISVLVGGV